MGPSVLLSPAHTPVTFGTPGPLHRLFLSPRNVFFPSTQFLHIDTFTLYTGPYPWAAHLGTLLEALAAPGGPVRSDALVQPAAEVGSTPMICSPGGYSVAPKATHRDTAKPAASPDRTPWGWGHREGRGLLTMPRRTRPHPSHSQVCCRLGAAFPA